MPPPVASPGSSPAPPPVDPAWTRRALRVVFYTQAVATAYGLVHALCWMACDYVVPYCYIDWIVWAVGMERLDSFAGWNEILLVPRWVTMVVFLAPFVTAFFGTSGRQPYMRLICVEVFLAFVWFVVVLVPGFA